MRTKRTRVATAVVALLLGGLLALFATSGPAVAFFSGGLFLDVQVGSPAHLVARGALRVRTYDRWPTSPTPW